jgi:InsA N-terminal domain
MSLEIHACPSCGSEEVSRNGQSRHGKQIINVENAVVNLSLIRCGKLLLQSSKL